MALLHRLPPARWALATGIQQPAARESAGVVVHVEEGVSEEDAGRLREWGHQLKHPLRGVDRLPIFGRGQMIVVVRGDEGEGEGEGEPAAKRARAAERRTRWAGSDGRGDGCAMGW